ncbi:MAG: M48 family metalloprotease, partial [Hyphomicrobiaceae bacterium]
EVAGVLAHELAHVKNRDTLTMTAAASIGGAVSMVGQYLQFGAIFGRRDSRTSWPAFLFGAVVAPFAAMLIQMAISRSREYQADRMGSLICGNPRWLMSALAKIDVAARKLRNPTAEAHPATAHMFIVNPLNGRGIDSFFSTHPKIENRLAELEKLEQEMIAAGTIERNEPTRPPSIIAGGAPWLRSPSSTNGSENNGGPWG